VKIIGNNGTEQQATVSRISGFIENQSVNVYLTYNATSKNSFLEGEYVDAIFGNSIVSGFEIPREAIVDNGFVYELKSGKLEKVEIEIIRQLNDSYIISGIDANKIIVTESLASVNPSTEYLART
jgi:hypothetical protein